jgi:hypothetical protein
VSALKASLTLALHRIRDTWVGACIPSKRSPDGAKSAFTRVRSPPKTGVNALKDALWRHPGGVRHPGNDIPDFAALNPGYVDCKKATTQGDNTKEITKWRRRHDQRPRP